MASLELALEKTFPQWAEKIPRLMIPPSTDFGELSSSIAHEIAREVHLSPHRVAEKIIASLQVNSESTIAAVEATAGYVNFRLNYKTVASLILSAVLLEGEEYGIVKVEQPIKISVEHTSANPSGPLTMGHARNSILGDALARILKSRGHSVKRRFYVDDVGKQVSILAYGYKLINEPKPTGKADQWFGLLYACINCALEIETAKKKLSLLSAQGGSSEERLELQRSLDEWVGIAAELETSSEELFTHVVNAVRAEADPEAAVQEISRKYESGEREIVTSVRGVAEQCLEGIRATLSDVDIGLDAWDWESQLVWDGRVAGVLDRLLKLPFTRRTGSSAALDVNAIVGAYSLRSAFGLSPNYEVPPLTLIRSDGTTLYPTRDIAYTLLKFEDSDRVINVIASEQTLPQLQIRLSLYALGERNAAENLIHYAYGLVELPGMKMSKRRARYVTLDEVLQQAKSKVSDTMTQRKEEFTAREFEDIVQAIALSAIRFAMISVSSTKNLTFTWERVLSLERNSAPFINYAFTRAASILRKMEKIPTQAEFALLTHPLERLLIFKIGQMPDIFMEAADQLKPEEVANYANSIAEKFHEYYEKVDVIHSDEQVKNARALLVKSVLTVLRNSMTLLGIKSTERM